MYIRSFQLSRLQYAQSRSLIGKLNTTNPTVSILAPASDPSNAKWMVSVNHNAGPAPFREHLHTANKILAVMSAFRPLCSWRTVVIGPGIHV
jgi:hypothetical protein